MKQPTRNLTNREKVTYRKLGNETGKAFLAYHKLRRRYRRVCERLEATGAITVECGVTCMRVS